MIRNRTLMQQIQDAPACCKTCPVVISICIMLIVYGCSATWSITTPSGKETHGQVEVERHVDLADEAENH